MPTIPLSIEGPLVSIASFGYFAFAILIAVYHLYSVRKNMGENAFKYEFLRENPAVFFSYLLLIAGFILGLNATLGAAIGQSSTNYCNFQKIIGPAAYVIFKCILYLTLISRTWGVYKNTIYHYNGRKSIIYCGIVVLWTVGNIIFNILTVQLDINKNKYPRCIVTAHTVFIISTILMDFIPGIINIILFLRPLIKLSKLRASDNSDFDHDIKIMAIKQTILAIIAIISTLFSMIFIGIFGAPKVFSSFDAVISTICIILMHHWHSQFVSKMLICCIQYIPSLQKQKTKDIANLEKVTSSTEITGTSIETAKTEETQSSNI